MYYVEGFFTVTREVKVRAETTEQQGIWGARPGAATDDLKEQHTAMGVSSYTKKEHKE